MARKPIKIPTRWNEHYQEEDKKHVSTIITWMNDSEARTNRWMAKSTNLSDAYISTLLSGNVNAPAAPLLKKCLAAIQDAGEEKAPGEFVKTTVWNTFKFVCQSARSTKRFSIFTGKPGVGKSTSAEEYQRQNPNTLYILGGESMSKTNLLDEIIDELNLNKKLPNNYTKEKAIGKYLNGTNWLILLDECDKCQANVAEALRKINDKAKVGVVLIGNTNLDTTVKAGVGKFDLIEDRATCFAEPVLYVTKEDVRLLLKPYLTSYQFKDGVTFEDFCHYAGTVCGGSARKLIENLMHNIGLLRNVNDKSGKPTILDYDIIQMIAKKFMGITAATMPPVPRKTTTQIPVIN